MSASDGSNFSRRAVLASGVLATVGLTVGRGAWAAEKSTADKSLPLITKAIPATKEKLPVIGIGTNAFGVSEAAELAARREVLKRLPELGGTVVDTAQAYGTSEIVIGAALAELGNRSKLFLATKTPISGDVSNAAETIRKSFDNLKTDKIDLLQIHNVHGVDELLPALLEQKKAGRIRYIGITTSQDGQYAQIVEAMKKHPFDFVQVDYSIDNRTAETDVFPVAADKGMAVLVNMPLGGRRGGNLMSKVSGRQLPKWAADMDVTSWAQFFLKYDVSHPVVTVAIPGTTKVSHLEDNLRAGRGRLPDADMRKRMEQFWTSGASAT
jgi:aryl-alcohol dehydrogenase-like predicted oxidoreductase